MNENEAAQDRHLSDHTQDYGPLIEELYQWQAIFEMALDEAAHHLTSEQFPAENLRASLADMCDILRAVLKKK